MKKIKLTRGKFALVDNKDYKWLNQWKWCCDSRGYAVRHERKDEYGTNPRKMIKMHKFIVNTPSEYETDHINHNRLNNRRNNLRIVNRRSNQMNAKLSKKNTSGYRGVYWDKKYKRWCARAWFYGKSIFGGGFTNKLDAVKAYKNLVGRIL